MYSVVKHENNIFYLKSYQNFTQNVRLMVAKKSVTLTNWPA